MADDSTTSRIETIWRKYDSVEQRLSAPLTERMLELAQLQPGMQVLDIATGRGEPAIPAAKRVLPRGNVVGVDYDHAVLQIAQEKADAAGITNLELKASDVETLHGVPRHFFDVALARWGLMYLKQPVQALRAIRSTLTDNGCLVAALWIDPPKASFFTLPRSAMANVVEVPPVNHDEPGTFYYSDLDRLARDLQAAGFELKHTETVAVDVMEVASDEELIAWARTFSASTLLQGASRETQELWERELVVGAEPYRGDDGTINLGGLNRIVVAT